MLIWARRMEADWVKMRITNLVRRIEIPLLEYTNRFPIITAAEYPYAPTAF